MARTQVADTLRRSEMIAETERSWRIHPQPRFYPIDSYKSGHALFGSPLYRRFGIGGHGRYFRWSRWSAVFSLRSTSIQSAGPRCCPGSTGAGERVHIARIELGDDPLTGALDLPSGGQWRKAVARFRG